MNPDLHRIDVNGNRVTSITHPRMVEVPRAIRSWGYFAGMHDPQEMLGPLMVEGDGNKEDLLAVYLELGAPVCVHPVARVF